ncbi:hypothetical protein [Nocardioides houyundeii]|uniref:hypothetical protein n=1 Tax=Nocardioides houyundeii TaxID=2045452 RepID=UPI000C76AF32|nr:hypothetical protein [Nocardioides houyundeii]
MTAYEDDVVGPPVGSVGEEAAKLLGALSDWAGERGPGLGQHVEDLIGQMATSFQSAEASTEASADAGPDADPGEQPGEPRGHSECTACPVCRVMHSVRGLPPEVRGHLGAAAVSLGRAVSAALAPAQGRTESEAVEHIALDDNEGWDRE